MRDPLDILIAERRREKAPSRTLDAVRARIHRDRPSHSWLRPVGIVFATVLMLALVLQAPWSPRNQMELTATERAEVLDQTMTSLAVIADALEKAGASSTETFFQSSAPPIRDGLESVKQKLIERFTI